MTQALVGRVVLGTASLSFDPDRDREADLAALRAGLDAGATIIDTARAYARADDPFYGERLAADAAAGRDVLVATKGTHSRVSQDDWDVDLSPQRLRADVDGSLEVLRTDRLDLYFVHRVDLGLAAGQQLAPAVEALADLRAEGKLARIGLSNVTVDDLEAASAIAPIDAVENRYSALGRRTPEALEWCTAHGVPFFAFSPLQSKAATPNLDAAAAQRGVSVQRLLLRAVLALSPVVSVVTGATRIPSVVDSVAAQTDPWDDDLEAAYRADLALENPS